MYLRELIKQTPREYFSRNKSRLLGDFCFSGFVRCVRNSFSLLPIEFNNYGVRKMGRRIGWSTRLLNETVIRAINRRHSTGVMSPPSGANRIIR